MTSCVFCFAANVVASWPDASTWHVQSSSDGSIGGSRWSTESVLPWTILRSISTSSGPVPSTDLVIRVTLPNSELYTLIITAPTWNNFGQHCWSVLLLSSLTY